MKTIKKTHLGWTPAKLLKTASCWDVKAGLTYLVVSDKDGNLFQVFAGEGEIYLHDFGGLKFTLTDCKKQADFVRDFYKKENKNAH